MKFKVNFILFLIAVLVLQAAIAQENIIQEINFTGLKRTKESFLRRLIKSKVETVYDSTKVATDLARLNRLPGIANATITLDQITADQIVLTYIIVENFTIIPGIRASQAPDNSFAFRLSVFEFNLLGRNQLIGGFYSRNVFDSYGGYWEAPYLFTNKLGLGINYIKNNSLEPVFPNDETVDYNYENNSFEIKGLYEFDFHNNAALGIRTTNERYVLQEDEQTTTLPYELSAKKFTVFGEYEHNNITIEYQYVTGYRNESNLEVITGGDGLLDDFIIARNDFELFHKVGKKGNWASRLRLAYSSNNDTPFAAFALDNALNIRGVGNVVDRGTASLVINTEYRHTLIERDWFVLQSNTFIDAGTWRKPYGSFNDLANNNTFEFNPGIGVRFIHKRIFNAVIRFDYGFGLGATRTNGFVFGIGQYF